MKNKILLIIILFISIILTIYFYIYKIKENFLTTNAYIFIGLDTSNKLRFYNKLDNSYYYGNETGNIINFLYHNKMLIVLDTSNNISYCTECDFTKKYSLTLLKKKFTIPIKNIAFDQEVGNNLFILFENKKFSLLKNFNTNLITIDIPIPNNEGFFIDFDAKYGKLVGIGNKTNLIYQTDINKTNLDTNFTKAKWNILDKNQSLDNIKITLYGYVGRSRYDITKFYLCNQFNNYKWTEIVNIPQNYFINNIEGTSSEGISFSIGTGDDIFLYIYDESYKDQDEEMKKNSLYGQFKQITTIDDRENYLTKMKVIDYIYPPLATVPELKPLDTASMVASSDNIKNKNENYQRMIQLLNDIDTSIKLYYSNQLTFNNNELNKKINDRNQKVIQFKRDIGMKETFEDINIDFKKINQKLKPSPTILIDGKKVIKPKGEDLIINYP
jgi:hypothetical protein